MNRTRPMAKERDRGLTLVELLVAMSVFAIAMTLITTLVVSVAQTFTREEAQHDSSTQAALGMQQMSRIIRAGVSDPRLEAWRNPPAFEVAALGSLTVHTYLGVQRAAEGPTRVRIALEGRELVETRSSATRVAGVWVYQASASRRHVIAQDVESVSFRYLDLNNDPLPLTGGALTEIQRGQVAAVEVTLRVQTAPGGDARPASLLSVVSLPSLNLTRVDP